MVTLNDIKADNQKEYIGLSKDTKPINCGVNSLFLELDTDEFYYFTGENWVKVGDE